MASVVRWKFTDVHKKGGEPYSYTFHINPNEASSGMMEKQLNISANAGPRRGVILQEGRVSPPVLQFSGVVLSQEHLETVELWYAKRILIDLDDDLGRRYRGVFTSYQPTRPYRARNFWYHTFSAQFTASAYRNASNQVLYGRFV